MNPIISSRFGVAAANRPQQGLSLIELMIAITLGMLVMAALVALFINISRSNSELAKSNAQIENGRFAIQLLQNDLVHAGFWGELRPGVAAAIPDPCLAVGSWGDAYKANMLAISVQGFANGSTLAGCGITAANVLSGSDVLVVRHANTCTVGSAGCDSTIPQIQVSSCNAPSPPLEDPYVIDSATFPLTNKDCTTPAARRKIVSNIYYLANNASNSCLPETVCPTLMRATLINGTYQVQPLIEGIEALRFEYGIDSNGDGSPDDAYLSTADLSTPPDPVQLANIVAVKVHVLARNLVATPGYTDSKAYKLGTTSYTVPTADAGFKRHVFSTTVRLVNPSGRRETP